MSAIAPDLSATIFAKTAIGQQEIQSRTLGLAPLVRRLLLLIDGQRAVHQLEVFVAGHDVSTMLAELMDRGCIEARAVAPAPVAPPAAAPAVEDDGLSSLPPADSRTFKELEMARNFMTNTVNNIFGHHNRISLIEAIHGCKTPQDLRNVYPAWVQSLSGSSIGQKRLPELREKLFAVL